MILIFPSLFIYFHSYVSKMKARILHDRWIYLVNNNFMIWIRLDIYYSDLKISYSHGSRCRIEKLLCMHGANKNLVVNLVTVSDSDRSYDGSNILLYWWTRKRQKHIRWMLHFLLQCPSIFFNVDSGIIVLARADWLSGWINVGSSHAIHAMKFDPKTTHIL